MDRQKILETADKCFNSGDWDGVIDLYTRLLKSEKANPLYYYRMAVAYKNKSVYHKALESLKVISSEVIYNENATETMVYKEYADVFYQSRDNKQALSYLYLVLDLDKDDTDTCFKIGTIFYEDNDHKTAYEYFKRCLNADQNYAKAFPYIGIILYRLARTDEALKYLKMALESSSDNKEVYFYMANVNFIKGAYGESIDLYKKSIENNYELYESHLKISQAWIELGEKDKAVQSMEAALTYLPDNVDEYEMLQTKYEIANLFYSMGRIQTANRLWKEIYNRDKEFKDVAVKVSSYSQVKKNDKLLDICHLPVDRYYEYCKKILFIKKHKVRTVVPRDDFNIEIKSTYFIKNSEVDCLSIFSRELKDVEKDQIDELSFEIKKNKIYKGMYFTVGRFTDPAKEEAGKWPIDLYNGTKMSAVVKNQFR